jgi:hypothetical protein
LRWPIHWGQGSKVREPPGFLPGPLSGRDLTLRASGQKRLRRNRPSKSTYAKVSLPTNCATVHRPTTSLWRKTPRVRGLRIPVPFKVRTSHGLCLAWVLFLQTKEPALLQVTRLPVGGEATVGAFLSVLGLKSQVPCLYLPSPHGVGYVRKQGFIRWVSSL